jgi:hypothetical protein
MYETSANVLSRVKGRLWHNFSDSEYRQLNLFDHENANSHNDMRGSVRCDSTRTGRYEQEPNGGKTGAASTACATGTTSTTDAARSATGFAADTAPDAAISTTHGITDSTTASDFTR